MANRILHSVARVKLATEGIAYGDTLHDLVSQYATAALYRDPDRLAHLTTRIARLASREFFAEANRLGASTADDLLSTIGRHASESGARRAAISRLRRDTAKNLANLGDGLKSAGLRLRGDTLSELRKARMGGETRRAVMRRLAKADRDDLKSWKQYQTEHKAAVRAETEAIERLSKRKGAKGVEDVKAAQKEQARVRRNMLARRSFLARFENATAREITDTFRVQTRIAQDARFREMGYGSNALMTWVTVNGVGTCPDCSPMHGEMKKNSDWDGERPGSGWTVCGLSCQCMLVPESYSLNSPELSEPLTAPDSPRQRERTLMDVPKRKTPLPAKRA